MPFADEMIGAWTAESLARAIQAAAPEKTLTRLRQASRQLDGLALRERADLLRDALLADIGGKYDDVARVVRLARSGSASFRGWMIWPVTSAIATRAVADGSEAAFDDALQLMADLTALLTSEFAIRTLLRHNAGRALATISTWSASDDVDVRRLASEGTRPYLPWSIRVPEIPYGAGATVPILDALYRDPSDYVRRSVANHLNDLSRDHAALVVETAARWLADADENTEWVIRHGLRTLVKRGDVGALSLLGFSPAEASLEVEGPILDNRVVAAGDAVEIRARIRNTSDEEVRLAVDYVVHHQKANGKQTPKTFKLTVVTLGPGESASLRRVHSFRPITTRRYYPGAHAISLQINGVMSEPSVFELTAD